MQLSPTLIHPGITTTTDDYNQLFVLDPDYVLPLQSKLTGLLPKFIERDRAAVMDVQASTAFADFRLPPMPCYPNASIDTDMLHKLEEAQRMALTTYLSFSLKYGFLEPSFVASTVQLDAFKRTRQRQENLDYSSYWQHKIRANLQKPDLDPTIVDFARQEMLTLYFAYSLIKGSLNENAIHRAKEEAFALYFGTFGHASATPFSAASTTDSEESSSDMSEDEDMQSMTSESSESFVSVASSLSSWTTVLRRKRPAETKHLNTDKFPHTLEGNDKIGIIKCRFHMKGRCRLKEKCTYAHDDISRLITCPMWKESGDCDDAECVYGHPHVNDQRIPHKEEPTSEKLHGQKGSKQWADTESKMAATSERHMTPPLQSSTDQPQNLVCRSLKNDTKETEDADLLTSTENSKANKKQKTGRGRRGRIMSLFTNDEPIVNCCYTYLNTNKCDRENCPYRHEPGEVKEKPVCKHWLKGQCSNGRLCQFLHDEGADSHILESVENKKYDVLDSDAFPTLGNHAKESLVKEAPSPPPTINYALAARQTPPASPAPRPKRKAICVDENGRAPTGGVIRKSEQSGSNDDNDSGLTKVNQMRLYTIKCWYWWNEDRNCRFRNCWFAHADVSRVDECHWWLQGNCLKGDLCLYRHTIADDDEAISDDNCDSEFSLSEMDEFSSNEDERSTKKTRKCIRFWFGNGCERDADECYYAHEDLQYVGSCDYWLNDKVCPHGSTCPYKHGEIIRALQWEDNPRKNNIFYDRDEAHNRRTDSEKRYLLIAKLRTPPSLETLPRMDSGCGKIELIYTPQRELAYSYGNKMCEASKLYQKAVERGDNEKAKKLDQEVKMLAKKMKKAHAVASQEIFTICNSDTLDQRKFIDVHGQHIGEAKQHIKQWLDGFHSSEPQVVYVVTGAGRHSKKEAASKGQLRPAILKYLQQMFETHETSVYGDNSGGVFGIIFCIHEYTPNYHCMKCPFIKKQIQ